MDNQLITSQESHFKKLASADFKESPRFFPDSLKLSDSEFWGLIEKSKTKYPNEFDAQMDDLTQQLSKLPNEQIIGFEMTLREKVVQLWDFNIKSLYQIIFDEYLSTDGFIYFRFWIVSNGKEFFKKALEDMDKLAEADLEGYYDGEGLMYVADEAFTVKNGDVSEEELPRDQAHDVDYDFGNYKMTGEYIGLDDFEKKFPALTERF